METTVRGFLPRFELTGDVGVQFLLGGYMKDFGDLLLSPDPDRYFGADLGVSARFYPADHIGIEAGYAIFGMIDAAKEGYDDFFIYNTSSIFGGPTFRLMVGRTFGLSAGGGVSFNFLSWGSSTGGTTKFSPGFGWYLKAQGIAYYSRIFMLGFGLQYLYFSSTNETGSVFDGSFLKLLADFGICF